MDAGSRSFPRDAAFFVALLATSFALGGALAHAFELPNKIGMAREAYFTVQTIYSGWNRLAFVLIIELAGILAVILLYRADPRVLWPACAALGGLVGAQIVFWVWTFPANQATANWTQQPENWEALRSQWEYSHLAGAVFQTIAMAGLIIAVLKRDRPRRDL
jgi:DMSO reductase anchor subunit